MHCYASPCKIEMITETFGKEGNIPKSALKIEWLTVFRCKYGKYN